MNELVAEYTKDDDGSMNNTFGDLLHCEKKYIPKGWETLDEAPKAGIQGVHSSSKVKNHGAHLLLLLAYIMVSNVLDDNSNDTQM